MRRAEHWRTWGVAKRRPAAPRRGPRGVWLRILPLGAVASASLAISACAGPLITADYAEQPATDDGLYRVRTKLVGAAFLKPGIRFAAYDAVVVDAVSVSYRTPPRRPTADDRAMGNYLLDLDSMDRLRRTFRDALERQMAQSEAFRVVDRAGPGVLRISGHIVDLVWEVPPVPGGESSFVLRTGELTLILDLRDSQTGERLARIADRRPLQPFGVGTVGMYENQPVNNWSAVRDVSYAWARLLREALDSLRELPRIPSPPQPPGTR